MTLCLLWRLILHFQLPQLISLAAIRAEVELVQAKAPAAPGCEHLQPTAPAEVAAEAESPHAAALLSWVQAVCAHYGLPVRSFCEGFGDGSAFCFLVGWEHVGGPCHWNSGWGDRLIIVRSAVYLIALTPSFRFTTIWATPTLRSRMCTARCSQRKQQTAVQVGWHLRCCHPVHRNRPLHVVPPPSWADLFLAAADPLAAGWAGGMGREQVEGARRNFARVQGVVLSLGGIPAMVSGKLQRGLALGCPHCAMCNPVARLLRWPSRQP